MTTTTTIPSLGTGQGANPLKGLLAYGQSPGWITSAETCSPAAN